jgi:glyoxylase-like metal-dependent hydrolase (beta-lactamase superfamily II)
LKILKRVVLVVVAVVLLVGLALAGVIWSAFRGNAPLPEAAELPGSARLVKDGMVAAFVLPAGGGAVALVDCGNDPAAARILAELSRRGARREDVKAILLTHGHGDHTGGCRQFPGAEVMALEGDVGLAGGAVASRGPLTRFARNHDERIVKVTRVLRDGETVKVGDLAVRVFAIPGHTDGSAAFLANGALFLGDSGTSREDGSFTGAPAPFSDDVDRNHASLRALWARLRQEGLAVEAVALAHSAPQQGTAALAAFAAGGDPRSSTVR